MTELQKEIMRYAKQQDFHATLRDFLGNYPKVSQDEAVIALQSLKSQRIAAVGPGLLDSWIGATNYGWKVMGWKE